MFKTLFKSSAPAPEAEKPVRQTRLDDLLAGEGQGDRIPLAAIHAQFDTMAQRGKVDNSRNAAMVAITRPASHG